MKGADLFRRESRVFEGSPNPAPVLLVTCRCGAEGAVRESHGRPLAPSKVAEKFRHLGWQIGQRPSCPDCSNRRRAAGPRLVRSDAAPAADHTTNTETEKDLAMQKATFEQPPPKASPPTLKAEPPREPTVADRRAIRDALDEHYDEDAQRYRQSWSDDALAAKLKKPRAWIAEVREQFYGPDRNEAAEIAAAEREAELERIGKRLEELDNVILRAVDSQAALKDDLQRLKGKAA